MDRFLSKRLLSSVSQPPSKKPSQAAKQGKVSASVRVAEFGRDKFHADCGKLFCRACNVVIEHTRKNTVERHLTRKVGFVRMFDNFAATKPRFSKNLSQKSRDFYDFCRDNAAIFRILACCGTAIFCLHYHDKFLPLVKVQCKFSI